MKRSIGFWQFIGFVFTGIGGVLLHFLYDWSGKSRFIAPFSGINESTWEHMKLLFFPLFVYALIEYFIVGKRKDFWCVKFIGIMIGLICIPIIFYFYNGAIGKSPDWFNIAIFFISAAVSFLIETLFFKKENFKCRYSNFAFIMICLIGISFIIFTFYPPELPIFKDPISGGFGLD